MSYFFEGEKIVFLFIKGKKWSSSKFSCATCLRKLKKGFFDDANAVNTAYENQLICKISSHLNDGYS